MEQATQRAPGCATTLDQITPDSLMSRCLLASASGRLSGDSSQKRCSLLQAM